MYIFIYFKVFDTISFYNIIFCVVSFNFLCIFYQIFKLIFYTAVSKTEILSQNLKNFPLQSVQSHLFVTLVRVASLSEPFDFSALSVFCTQNFVFLLLSMPYHT